MVNGEYALSVGNNKIFHKVGNDILRLMTNGIIHINYSRYLK